jgi:hypothetical protein
MSIGDSMTTSRARIRELKAEFDAAHEAGMASLEAHDYEGLGDAISRERELIEEQASMLDTTPPPSDPDRGPDDPDTRD